MEIVDADVTGSINIETTGCGIGTISKIYPETIILRTKKPYALNPSNIECVVGEWNKDKGEYGVRVYFVSGNNQWFGGKVARSLLRNFTRSEESERKFDERVKAGPPSV